MKAPLLSLIAMLVSILSVVPAGAAGSDEQLSVLEQTYFHHNNRSLLTSARLAKLEQFVYGVTRTGSTEERLARLNSALTASSIGSRSSDSSTDAGRAIAGGFSGGQERSLGRVSGSTVPPSSRALVGVRNNDLAADRMPGSQPALSGVGGRKQPRSSVPHASRSIRQEIAHMAPSTSSSVLKPSFSPKAVGEQSATKQKSSSIGSRTVHSAVTAAPFTRTSYSRQGRLTGQRSSIYRTGSLLTRVPPPPPMSDEWHRPEISPYATTNNRRANQSTTSLVAVLSQLEQSVFGRASAGQPVIKRVRRLERRVLNGEGVDELAPLPVRVERLQARLTGGNSQSSGSDIIAEQTSAQATSAQSWEGQTHSKVSFSRALHHLRSIGKRAWLYVKNF